jgi:hypothetical protein
MSSLQLIEAVVAVSFLLVQALLLHAFDKLGMSR